MIPAALLAALVACSPATVQRWTHAPATLLAARLAILPERPCVMQADNGRYLCSRTIGCTAILKGDPRP
jgi:hypothetical protein